MFEVLKFWHRPPKEVKLSEEDIIERSRSQIQNGFYQLLIARLNDPAYPHAPEHIVKKIAEITNRGASKHVAVRAAIDLNPDDRLSQARKNIDEKLLFQTPAGRTDSCAETIPAGKIGFITDVDDDCHEGPLFFIIKFPIKDPNSNKYRVVTAWVPSVSYVKGNHYEELDFSLIDETPGKIAEIDRQEQERKPSA